MGKGPGPVEAPSADRQVNCSAQLGLPCVQGPGDPVRTSFKQPSLERRTISATKRRTLALKVNVADLEVYPAAWGCRSRGFSEPNR